MCLLEIQYNTHIDQGNSKCAYVRALLMQTFVVDSSILPLQCVDEALGRVGVRMGTNSNEEEASDTPVLLNQQESEQKDLWK